MAYSRTSSAGDPWAGPGGVYGLLPVAVDAIGTADTVLPSSPQPLASASTASADPSTGEPAEVENRSLPR